MDLTIEKRGIEGLCVNLGTGGKRDDMFGRGGASIQLDRQCVVLKPVYQKT